jgi:hypothetical protein
MLQLPAKSQLPDNSEASASSAKTLGLKVSPITPQKDGALEDLGFEDGQERQKQFVLPLLIPLIYLATKTHQEAKGCTQEVQSLLEFQVTNGLTQVELPIDLEKINKIPNLNKKIELLSQAISVHKCQEKEEVETHALGSTRVTRGEPSFHPGLTWALPLASALIDLSEHSDQPGLRLMTDFLQNRIYFRVSKDYTLMSEKERIANQSAAEAQLGVASQTTP